MRNQCYLVFSLLCILQSRLSVIIENVRFNNINGKELRINRIISQSFKSSSTCLHAKRRSNIGKVIREINDEDNQIENEILNLNTVETSNITPKPKAAIDPTPLIVKRKQGDLTPTGIFEEIQKDYQELQKKSLNKNNNYDEFEKTDFTKNNLIDSFPTSQSTQEQSPVNEVMKTIKNGISLILVADFFVIMVFLVWFLVAAALQSTYPVVLERFQDIFQPVVVPALTVLMVGSIASGIVGDREPTSNTVTIKKRRF
eukprot:gene6374-8779_t